MPALNNSGKQGEPTRAPDWDVEAIRSLLTVTEPYDAAEHVLATLAESHSYAPRVFKRWHLDGWSGSERPLGGGYWGSIRVASRRPRNQDVAHQRQRVSIRTDGRSATNEAQVGKLDQLWSTRSESAPGGAMDLMPSWVEPDPLRGRAVDALGLQATADRIADDLLPGLSVLTTRARYFTFLAWARASCGSNHDETRVHRLEVALAIREAQLSASDPDHRDDCRYVGSRSLARVPFTTVPREPGACTSPGVARIPSVDGEPQLIDRARSPDRRRQGCEARAFGAASRGDSSGRSVLPKSACLPKLLTEGTSCSSTTRRHETRSTTERRRRCVAPRCTVAEIGDDLDTATGFWARAFWTVTRACRSRSPCSRARTSRGSCLGAHFVWSQHLVPGVASSRRAWWARTVRLKERVNAARRRQRQTPPDLVDVDRSSLGEDRDEALAYAFTSLRAGLLARERLGVDAMPRSEPAVFELARAAVSSTPLDTILRDLEDRHLGAKADDAWIRRRNSGRVEIARDTGDKWELPRRVRLHPYRLWAFGQIMVDLWHAR